VIIFFLYRAHQTHFEQMGYLNATIEIDGENHTVKMPSFRDHSYGKRIVNFLKYYLKCYVL
jgi:hypothetical protein